MHRKRPPRRRKNAKGLVNDEAFASSAFTDSAAGAYTLAEPEQQQQYIVVGFGIDLGFHYPWQRALRTRVDLAENLRARLFPRGYGGGCHPQRDQQKNTSSYF